VWPESEPEVVGELLLIDTYDFSIPVTVDAEATITLRMLENATDDGYYKYYPTAAPSACFDMVTTT